MASIDPEIRAAFGRWWRTGSLEPPVEVAGYTVPRLMAEFQFNPVVAFATLDAPKRDPRTTLGHAATWS